MRVFIVIFGALIALMGLVVMLRPGVVLTYADRHAGKPVLHTLAVVIRLILGAALLLYADQSSFPITLKVIGWVSIAAACMLLVIGRDGLRRLIHRAVRFAMPYGRLAGTAALLFGVFIVYAVV